MREFIFSTCFAFQLIVFLNIARRTDQIHLNRLIDDRPFLEVESKSLFDDNGFESHHRKDLDYVIVHPTRVDRGGEFLSNKLTYFVSESDSSSRSNRDSRSKPSSDDVYYSLEVKGHRLVLNVSANRPLLHPDFMVERFSKKEGDDKLATEPPFTQRSSLRRGTNHRLCHLRGHVIGHPGSSVAVSSCRGLSGLIRLRDIDYFIEPINNLPSDDLNNPQLHKMYERNPPASKQSVHDKMTLRRKRRSLARRKKQKRMNMNSRPGRLMSNQNHHGSTFATRNFCGVTDTRRQYRRDLRRRRIWEARRRRKASRHDARRQRRSLSLEHWIELLVVVDHRMVKHYEEVQGGDVEQYVLTIVNMVSELFHDVSIGNSLHVTLIRLIVLDENEESLKITSHAEKTLESFCSWAKRMNPQSDQHANHHDVAVLLTRQNLCSQVNKSCETLGLAHVAGMCQPHRSCNVNQDTGLSLAFTVAHELGHNFAMHHDGQMNSCEPNDDYPRIMAPHLTSNNLPMRWSSCSRRYVTRFLDRNWGFCLLDSPSPDHDHFDFPEELPGTVYSADHQCELMFGPGAKHCKKIEGQMCTRLWCYHRGTCRTRLHAAALGTECAPGKWCYGGSCVPIEKKPLAVDGAWGPWTHWSRCSRTCGVGVSHSARYCNQPSPRHGGKYCLGERRRYRTCNVWSCPKMEKSVSFRTEQCMEFNNIPYHNNTYHWMPVDSQVYPCELHCYTRDGKHPFADRLRDKVVDGTKCFSHGNDICVDGICKRLGCDFIIDSLASEDKCGVCRGDGSTCSEVNNNFTLQIGDEYVPAGLIPKGASRIVVTELAPSGNFLALRSARNESEYFLNGNYMIQHDFQFDLAGTIFNYRRVNKTTDNITAEGPISHDIVVMLLFVEENPGVNISYIMPHNVSAVLNDRRPVFEWRTQPWTECSTTCGQGVQTSSVVCVEEESGEVEEDFCDLQTRPEDGKQVCRNPDCPAEWFAGPWEPCSITCGGSVGRQKRAVLCVQSTSDHEQIALNSTECNDVLRPEEWRSCSADDQQPCPIWKTDSWSECSKSCNSGLRRRLVKCVTYVIDDVIPGDDFSMSDSHHNVFDNQNFDLDSETGGSSISRVTIVERLPERNLLEDFEYEEEKEDECDSYTRPMDVEDCNPGPCPQVSIRSNHSFPPTLYDDPLLSLPTFENTLSRTLDLDLDASTDHNASRDSNNQTFSPGSSYDDPLDRIAPSPHPSFDPSTNVTSDHPETRNPFQHSSDDVNTTIETTVALTTPIPEWLAGKWGQCSTTCGVGARIRNVVCSGGKGKCDDKTRPPPAQRCRLKPCVAWKYAGWTKCSRSCGVGRKRRKVFCRGIRSNQLFRPYHCNSLSRLPRINTSCNARECIPWRTSRWARCNVSCGVGTQRRRVVCHRKGMCDPLKRPAAQKNCRLRKCYEWRTYHWGRCPVKCGIGIKRRLVQCQEKETGSLSRACNPRFKPTQVKKCNKGPCRVTDFDFSSCTGDRLKSTFCAILRSWGKCVQPSLAIQCCRTCKTFINVRRKDKIS